MIARGRLNKDMGRSRADDAPRDAGAVALWSALFADRRARDERTARLRAMRLIAGEDAVATV